jgi:hypothetical protein
MKLFLSVVLLAVLFLPLHSDPAASAGNRLDQLQRAMSYQGESFIKSYHVLPQYQCVDIQIDSSIWDTLTTSQQLRLCDAMANTDFLQKMHLLNAYLYVDSTKVGVISPNMWGGGNSFAKEERYWNP